MASDGPTDRSDERRSLVMDVVATVALGVGVSLMLALTLMIAVYLGADLF